MTALVEQAPAKINLTLRILGRRADGYHELESLVAFAALADTLALQPGGGATLEISGPFAAASGPPAGNLVLKALAALRQCIDGLTAGSFRLQKNIPVAAGIGGGSADAAAALRLIARANGLALDDRRLAEAARLVGADVPVCLDSRIRIMRGLGEVLSAPLAMPSLPALLVNPGVPLVTRDVFEKFTAMQGDKNYRVDLPQQDGAPIEWLEQGGNDLTEAAISSLPVIADVLDRLRALPAVRLARMSGSGPTCFALFASAAEVAAAGQRLKAECPDWWVCTTTLGASA